MSTSMKPYIILVGARYYPAGWDDYAGEADTLEEATALAEKKMDEDPGMREYRFYEIVDLRTKQCVLRAEGDHAAYDPRQS